MLIHLDSTTFDALIFDCDGTLVDSSALYFRSLQSVFGSFGLPFDRDWYLARTGLTPVDLFLVYGREVSPLPATIPELMALTTEAFQRDLHTLEEITVVADIARQWHGEVPMAVASNGQRGNVVGSLRATGLLAFFNAIITIDDVTHGKPAPDIYLEAARQLKIPPTRCTVLEDSDEGLTAARAANMTAVDVRPHLSPYSGRRSDDRFVASLIP